MNLEAVDSFQVPETLVRDTEESLHSAGLEGFERFVLWSGQVTESTLVVKTMHVPEQEAFKLPTGLLVRVEGEALHRLNSWLYEQKEVLGVQVHAHPKEAFHSETDDAFPIVTLRGGLSIVAPDFCRRGLLVRDAAVYRLTERGWLPQDQNILEVT